MFLCMNHLTQEFVYDQASQTHLHVRKPNHLFLALWFPINYCTPLNGAIYEFWLGIVFRDWIRMHIVFLVLFLGNQLQKTHVLIMLLFVSCNSCSKYRLHLVHRFSYWKSTCVKNLWIFCSVCSISMNMFSPTPQMWMRLWHKLSTISMLILLNLRISSRGAGVGDHSLVFTGDACERKVFWRWVLCCKR